MIVHLTCLLLTYCLTLLEQLESLMTEESMVHGQYLQYENLSFTMASSTYVSQYDTLHLDLVYQWSQQQCLLTNTLLQSTSSASYSQENILLGNSHCKILTLISYDDDQLNH